MQKSSTFHGCRRYEPGPLATKPMATTLIASSATKHRVKIALRHASSAAVVEASSSSGESMARHTLGFG